MHYENRRGGYPMLWSDKAVPHNFYSFVSTPPTHTHTQLLYMYTNHTIDLLPTQQPLLVLHITTTL